MTERARPWIKTVWERSFALEDAADEFYEQAMERYEAPFEVDRFDAHVVRVYLDTKQLESHAQSVEASVTPLGFDSPCRCGHALLAHEDETSYGCSVEDCDCRGYERP